MIDAFAEDRKRSGHDHVRQVFHLYYCLIDTISQLLYFRAMSCFSPLFATLFRILL